MKNLLSLFVILIFVFVFSNNSFFAQNPIPDEKAVIENLEKFYNSRDFEIGAETALEMSRKFPESRKIKAWSIIFEARIDKSKKTVERGEKLFAENPDDEFILYALGNAYLQNSKFGKALESSEKLIQLAPENQNFILLHAYALMSKKRFAEALQFLDSKEKLFSEKSLWYTAKAEIYFRQKEKEKSFAAFERAISENPKNVTALYVAGSYYNTEKLYDKSFPLLKRAVEISPGTLHIRQALLDALLHNSSQNTVEKREGIINSEIESYLKAVSETPKSLYNAVLEYRRLEMTEKQKEFENRLLEKFPQTREGELVLIYRLRRFDTNNELKRLELIKKLREFLARPQFFEQKYVGEVYNNLLFFLQSDKDFSDAEYLKLAKKAVEFEGLLFFDPYLTIATGLIKRSLFAEAEIFAHAGVEFFEKRIIEARKDESYAAFVESFDRAKILNVLGEALLRQKKYEEAEKILLKSIAASQKYNVGFKFLGELYEATERFDRAEDAYISETAYFPKDNQNFDPLKNLYQKRNGNLKGFEAYLSNVKKLSKIKLREFIIADKHPEPKKLADFNLLTFDGKNFSSDSLKGKVVVINIWATWCGPCVREMPDLQLLYKKYQKSSDVKIITINSEEDAEKVKKFMLGKKYSFPALLSSDYLTDLKINALPTTWFVDKQGKIIYTQIGYSKFLFDEFDWRIEELRK